MRFLLRNFNAIQRKLNAIAQQDVKNRSAIGKDVDSRSVDLDKTCPRSVLGKKIPSTNKAPTQDAEMTGTAFMVQKKGVLSWGSPFRSTAESSSFARFFE